MRRPFKKKIEGVKLLGLREFGSARGFGGYSGGGGHVIKQNLWGVRKKREILEGYQNLSRHGKKYFLSMLPLVGDTYGETEQSVGEHRGFLICKTLPICR